MNTSKQIAALFDLDGVVLDTELPIVRICPILKVG